MQASQDENRTAEARAVRKTHFNLYYLVRLSPTHGTQRLAIPSEENREAGTEESHVTFFASGLWKLLASGPPGPHQPHASISRCIL